LATVKLLLDTHAFLWAIDQPARLSKQAAKALLDGRNELQVSVASIWEIRLKVQAGQLKLPAAPEYLEANLRKLGVKSYLPIELFHVYQTDRWATIHEDPFDRMPVAQAMVEGMTLVSKDAVFAAYGLGCCGRPEGSPAAGSAIPFFESGDAPGPSRWKGPLVNRPVSPGAGR